MSELLLLALCALYLPVAIRGPVQPVTIMIKFKSRLQYQHQAGGLSGFPNKKSQNRTNCPCALSLYPLIGLFEA